VGFAVDCFEEPNVVARLVKTLVMDVVTAFAGQLVYELEVGYFKPYKE
jgi:hypothetical protein